MRNFVRRAAGMLIFVGSLMLLAPVVSVVKGQYEIAQFPYNGSGYVAPGVILLPDGTVSAPALGFSGAANTGIYRVGVSLNVALSGTQYAIISTTGLSLLNNAMNLYMGGSQDLIFNRQAGAVLQMGVDAATATNQTIKGSDSTGATVTGGNLTIRAGDGTSGVANGGQLILGGGLNATTGEPGAVAFEDRGTRPTCAVGIRGSIWYDAAGAGAADSIAICAHKSDNSYAWVELATPIS